jgi:acetoin utilization deacetylase AcuC-like enzyme
MTVHRHAGIKRVALLDFDVHHGNGTEACVANTAPSLAKYAFTTPYGEGVQQFPAYRPWHDIDDKDNIFFASVQGYGPKAPGYMDAYVYPGSGATCDTKGMLSREVEELADEEDTLVEGAIKIDELDATTGVPASQAANTGEQQIEEDPDHEFVYSGGEMPRTEGPRIIDVGIPGPGSRVALWRRSWRDKILPALVKFDPDIIFISAGFDAHKKDDINFAYIGVQEKDYEWLTDQIVQVANRCCQGRVVSVLEGGYKIQGQVVSAFARSVAAHVKAMAEPNGQEWDPRDAKWEREHEKQLRAEAEAKRQAAAEAAAAARIAAAAEVAAAALEAGGSAEEVPLVPGDVDMLGGSPLPVNIASPKLDVAAADGGEEEEDGSRRKRRRSTVDYVALNKKLEEEQKAAGGPAPPQ